MPAAHILTFAQSPDTGGVERAQLRLVAGWAAAGRRVTLVLGAAGPDFRPPPGVDLVDLGTTHFGMLRALPSVVLQQAPDLVFCPGNHYTGVAAWLRARLLWRCPPIVAKLSNAPARADHGAVMDRLHAIWLWGHRWFLDHLVAMTPATAAAAEGAFGMRGRINIIPNPPTAAPPGAAPIALPPGPVILGVGRLVPQKRWDRLIRALPELPGAHLMLLGEGAERPDLEALARDLGVADRVGMPGHAVSPLDAMAQASVVALPSDFEGVPGVLREALSVGTPVVATESSPAVREIVTGPTQGDIIARDDHPALVKALRHRLVPGAPRPAPVPQPGADSVARYLALFDRLTA